MEKQNDKYALRNVNYIVEQNILEKEEAKSLKAEKAANPNKSRLFMIRAMRKKKRR